MRRLFSGVVCAAAFAFTACGGCGAGGGQNDGSNNGGGNNDELGTGELRQVLSAMCDYMERCPSPHYAIAYRNRRECVDILDFVLTCRVIEEGEDDSETYTVQQIPVSTSQSQKQECLEWLNSVDCGESLEGDSNPCVFLSGAFDDDDESDSGALRGEMCEQENCIEGLECVPSGQSTGELEYCRICVPPGGPGTPCTQPHRPCREGLACNSQLGLCDYPLEEGESCEEGVRPCVEGTFCTYDTRICAALYDDGEDCLYEERPYDQFCASGFCNPNTSECDPAGEEGDSCSDDADCRPYESLTCEGGKCTAPAPNGAPCTDNQQCQHRNCDMTTGRCGQPDGTECRDDSDCESGNCGGQSFDGVCEPTRQLGESCDGGGCGENVCRYDRNHNFQSCRLPCVEQADCPADHVCDGDACHELQPDGSHCRDDEQCLSGWCSFDSETCGKKPGIGDACSGFGDCYPRGYCSGGACVARKGPGDSCDSMDSCLEPYICLDGQCERISLSCQPAKPGEMCTWLRVCDETAYCDPFDSFTCKPKKSSGGSCNRSEECLGDLVCEYGSDGGVCTEPADAGDDCSSRECGPDLYCDRDSFTCADLKEPGEPCDDDDECKGEAYCDGETCVSNNPAPECVLPEEE